MISNDLIIRVQPSMITTAFLPTMEKRAAVSNYSDGLKLGFWRNRPVPELPPNKKRIVEGILPGIAEDLTLPEDMRWAEVLIWWSYGLIESIKPRAIMKAVGLRSLEEYQFALDCLGNPQSKAWNRFKSLNTIEMVINFLAPKVMQPPATIPVASVHTQRTEPVLLLIPSQELEQPIVIPATLPLKNIPQGNRRPPSAQMATSIEDAGQQLFGIKLFPGPYGRLNGIIFFECLWVIAHWIARPRSSQEFLADYNVRFRRNDEAFTFDQLEHRIVHMLWLPQLFCWKQRESISHAIRVACNALFFALHGTETALSVLIHQWTDGDRARFRNIQWLARIPARPLPYLLPAAPDGISRSQHDEYDGIMKAEYHIADFLMSLDRLRLTPVQFHERRQYWRLVPFPVWSRYVEAASKLLREITPHRARAIMDTLFLVSSEGPPKEEAMKLLGVATDEDLKQRLAQDDVNIPGRWKSSPAQEDASEQIPEPTTP